MGVPTVRERIHPAGPTNDDLKHDLRDVWKNDQWVRILLLFTVIPGIGYLLTAGVVRLMKVDRSLMKTIQRDLALRRTAAQAGGAQQTNAIQTGVIK